MKLPSLWCLSALALVLVLVLVLVLALVLALALASPLAQAHVSLEQVSAPAGAYQKLTFRIGHGCNGSATNGITILLPEGVTGAKPMPKAGWSITIVESALAAPLVHGVALSRAVRAVSWKGGPLPDAQYDEFSLQIKLPDATGKYYFNVHQVCEQGSALGRGAWRASCGDEIPGTGA